jgi:hypothetical protein
MRQLTAIHVPIDADGHGIFFLPVKISPFFLQIAKILPIALRCGQ